MGLEALSAQWALVGLLEPLLNAPPVECVCAVQLSGHLLGTELLDADGALVVASALLVQVVPAVLEEPLLGGWQLALYLNQGDFLLSNFGCLAFFEELWLLFLLLFSQSLNNFPSVPLLQEQLGNHPIEIVCARQAEGVPDRLMSPVVLFGLE